MSDRTREHAEILVHHSAEIEEGDMVVVSGTPETYELVEEVYKVLGEVGAVPFLSGRNSEASRLYYEEVDEEQIVESEHSRVLWENTDASISIRGSQNSKTMSSVDPELQNLRSKVNEDGREARLDTRWVLTQHPTNGQAQEAGMSRREYADFVYNAVLRDWGEQRDFQSDMVDILEDGSEVRIRSGDTTDIHMNIDGMIPVNDYGARNMPGGEVFTAPVKDSVNGEVLFDMPLITRGREVQDVYLEFDDGEVVDYSASQNEETIESVLETDEGASYLGELGIGMNRGIDQFTYNMLFDEKMGDTVHMALGRAYDKTVGEDRKQNMSAIHMDMIVDMSEESTIELDGEVVQENGTFVFED
jgi:aminopeptidase